MARSNGIRPPIDAPTISLPANFSVAENIGSAPITVTKSGNLSQVSTIPYTIIPVTAGVADYTSAASGILVFSIGDSVKTIPNSIIDDFIAEPTETYLFLLGADDSTWVRGNNTCVVSIIDNDTFVNTQTIISISSPTAVEGANLVFTITLSGITQLAQTFAVTIGGTATAGTDYATPIAYSNGVTFNNANSTINIPIGVFSFSATTMTATDSLIEGTETLILSLGGITAIGNITDVLIGTLTAISRMTAFETPLGMLSTAQQTASATSGGYITACASRTDTSSDNYAVDISTTGPNGTYTRMLDNRQYSSYAEVINVLSYKHADVPFVNEFDLPATLTANTIGVMQDENGVQEFGLYSSYSTNTLAGVSGKSFNAIKSAIFDTTPIVIEINNSAKIFLLNNLAQDTVLRTNGTTAHLKFISKLGTQEFTGASTPIAVTIANRASKPLPPRNVQFGANGELYSFPIYLNRADLTLQVDSVSRAETIPSGFFSPSGLNEVGQTYEVDISGPNGFIRTITLPANGIGNFSSIYTLNTRDITDTPFGVTNYKFYTVKGGIRSLPFSYNLEQGALSGQMVTGATATLSGSNILIAVTLDSPTLTPNLIDYFLGGTVFTTEAYGTITCDSGVLVMSNQLLQVPVGVTSFTMTVSTMAAEGKTLTTAWGIYSQFPTSTFVGLTPVSYIQPLQNDGLENPATGAKKFVVNFASPTNAGNYPFSFSGTATYGGINSAAPTAGADYTVNAEYYTAAGGPFVASMANNVIAIPSGLTAFGINVITIVDGLTEAAETIIVTINGTVSPSIGIDANAT